MLVELTDTHCHLNLTESFPDPEPYFDRAFAAGVSTLMLVALDPQSGQRALDLAESHESVFAIVGRHPHYAQDAQPADLQRLREMLIHPKAVALGEIGLDFHWDYASPEQQQSVLIPQLDLAVEMDKPVVFHCRKAYAELLGILEKRPPHPYLFHCFAGTAEDAARAQTLDCYFGFDGPLTYKKSHELREIVRTLRPERIVLETDSPYMTPEPLRGKPNEPANLPLINAALAETLAMSPKESAHLTTQNARLFFRLA
jgi:TatD DNase family protein